MSVQFGRWSFDGQPAAPEYLAKVCKILLPYGPDGGYSYSNKGVDLLYHALHTTKESHLEAQPHVLASGSVITWDGRLDNRTELIGLFDGSLSPDSTDVSLAAAAYERWGTDCFAKLIGDWALAIWNPKDGALILAKDPIGTRHLHYSIDLHQVTWSTILDPLVLLAERSLTLDEEYIAGWFSFFPSSDLTPYVGIHSVPPSSYVRVKKRHSTVSKYWSFDPANRIGYRTDREYEEHFRDVFAQSVARRLRCHAPILAELSGGIDSSSIVCMAHSITGLEPANYPRLDTLSYYNDSEPNWNERPYFTKVEEKLGLTGCHIDVSERWSLPSDSAPFAVTPGSGQSLGDASSQLANCMATQGNRVVLSGIGGDEVTGGVPAPTTELMDALRGARFRTLAHGLKVWALEKRKLWLRLLLETAGAFLPPTLVGVPKQMQPPRWLLPSFTATHRAALNGYPSRVRLFGSRPSFQANISTLEAVQRQLACWPLSLQPPHERRFPYLDRHLLEFLYAVPREQLVRPGQRRSLMRRALRDIVPAEILNRKRKAFVARSPAKVIVREWGKMIAECPTMLSSSLNIVDQEAFAEVVGEARRGGEVHVVAMMRTLQVESWLRNIAHHRLWQPAEFMSRSGATVIHNAASSCSQSSAS
jgi:asparagine synthase (glutamine-hydrolysing)